jgi:hypothetical protein
MATTDVYNVIDRADLGPNETVGWWWGWLPEDDSVYVVFASPWGFSAHRPRERVIPDRQIMVTNVRIHRDTGVFGAAGPRWLVFDIVNQYAVDTPYRVLVARIQP